MCGIAGAIGATDPTVKDAVAMMTNAQRHRGPDDSGTYVTADLPGVALGFRRLAIIDLSRAGHQPMHDESSGNVLVFNGEIYNYVELRDELEQQGIVFRSDSDSEVLLRGYARWGEGIVARLCGMFAFAIYEPKNRRVLLARDRLGIKPLYYTMVERPEGRALLFASELRALLATRLCASELDPAGLQNFLWNGFVTGPSTIVRKIQLFPAACLAEVRLDAPNIRPRRYWPLGPRPRTSRTEAVHGLEQALLAAARQHMTSDVPLAVFLSGGIDSSAIASLAVRSTGRNVHTFHVSFEESGFDESMYARRVAQALGTQHAELRLTQERFRANLDAALASLDQPTFDGINTYFVSRMVREAGYTVALAGTGGDELFGGYRSFRDLPRAHRAARVARLLPERWVGSVARLVSRRRRGAALGHPPRQTRWGKLEDLLSTGGGLVPMYQIMYGLYTRDFLAQLSQNEALELGSYGLSPERQQELERVINGESALASVSNLELALFVGERLLRDTDAASMAVSVEVRVPLLDHRVVEAAQAVPDQARFYPLGAKALLRSSAMPSLDGTLFDRPKVGFVLPIEVWAKDELARDIEALFENRGLVESVGLRHTALGALWRAFRAGAPGLYWSRIWAPYVLLQWCERHGLRLG